MQDKDKAEFAKLLIGVASYYERTLATATIDVYWNGLREFDLDGVRRAMTTHAQNPDSGQWMPKVADIVRVLQGRTGDQAAQAWAKVDAAMRRIGGYADVVFDDALIHRVLTDMGGWLLLSQRDDEAWPHVAREFENRYRGYRMRGEQPEYPPIMLGVANTHNGQNGFRLEPPMLVGDLRQAQRVMSEGTAVALLGMVQARAITARAPMALEGRGA